MKKANIILTILLFAMVSLNAFAQIPNRGFENWIDAGTHLNPEGWWTTNDSVSSGSFFPVTRSVDHYPPAVGEYSLRMENKPELYPGWASVGIAWTGEFEGNNSPVFPVPGHPTSLWGYFKFLPENKDTFEIHIRLYQDGEDTGGGSFKTSDLVSSWTPFQVIFSDYVEADSGRILFSACYDNDAPIPHGNSVLYIDNLNFDSLITGRSFDVYEECHFSVYPNPANDRLTLSLDISSGKQVYLSLYDAFGHSLLTQDVASYQETVILDVSTIPPGMYFLRVGIDKKIIDNRKVIILR